MKLYELTRGELFMITQGEPLVPPGEVAPTNQSKVFKHECVDGMYSRNYDSEGHVHYLAAYTEVARVAEEIV